MQPLGSLKGITLYNNIIEIYLNQLGSQREFLDIENMDISDHIVQNLDLKIIKSKFESQL